MIEFIYFDVGGTLIDPHPSVGDVYARAGRPHGLTASPEELQAAFRTVWRSSDPAIFTLDFESTEGWWRTLVFDVLLRVGYEGDCEACFQSFFSAFERTDAWRIYDDVIPALTLLSERGLGRGVISNWDHRLGPLLDRLDLTRWFDPILISAHEGLAKPDVAFYRRATERAGVAPSRILSIGDREDLDFLPAKKAGFHALLIERSGRGDPTTTVRSLVELVDRVEFIGR